jgi:hypothetical protein
LSYGTCVGQTAERRNAGVTNKEVLLGKIEK